VNFFKICDGQLEWEELGAEFDNVVIGKGDQARKFPVIKGKEEWIKSLKTKFPKETEAIDKFFVLIEAATGSARSSWILLKLIPLWVSNLLISTGKLCIRG
jgi:hypothetical protein